MKEYRRLTRLGLREAKDAIDAEEDGAEAHP
jgi:ribosomal protein L7/L12